jgi:acetolactate synthase-1/3 small subunit
MSEINKHAVLAILLDNESGALARVVDLFSARGYNIQSLTVAPVSLDKKLSRITVTTEGSPRTIDLICKLLKRIVPVYNAVELTRETGYIERELTLVKVIGNEEKREKAIAILDKYRSHIVDLTGNSAVFEIIGSSKTIDEALKELSAIGLSGVSRTGIAAGYKGDKKLNNENY